MKPVCFSNHYAFLCSRAAVLVAAAVLILVAFPFNRSLVYSLAVYGRYPPLYPQHRELETELPHYESYRRSDIKYLWSPNHPSKVGWGNIMQDYILNYVLAYATNRSFVFDDYTWAVDGTPYSHFNGKLIPSRIPLNAVIDGPLTGGPMPPGDNTPRAVHKDFFRKVCPNPTILRLSDVSPWSDSDTVKFVFDKWVDKISSIEDPCLQFEETSPDKQIFNVQIYGQKERLLSIWPYMSKLPVLSWWGWSSLIHEAFEANRDIIFPPSLYWPQRRADARDGDTLAGLLVIHVRRGDFDKHCKFLSEWNADWNAFNSFPELPDKYDKERSDPRTSTENREAYMARCYPTVPQIVERVRTVRQERQLASQGAAAEGKGDVQDGAPAPLEYLYIMTNGSGAWVEDLTAALYDLGGWTHVGSSRDLRLTWEQKFVAQAVDMMVAQRAQVFVGNGWSSLTSNVVMLRSVDGMPPESNRFW